MLVTAENEAGIIPVYRADLGITCRNRLLIPIRLISDAYLQGGGNLGNCSFQIRIFCYHCPTPFNCVTSSKSKVGQT